MHAIINQWYLYIRPSAHYLLPDESLFFCFELMCCHLCVLWWTQCVHPLFITYSSAAGVHPLASRQMFLWKSSFPSFAISCSGWKRSGEKLIVRLRKVESWWNLRICKLLSWRPRKGKFFHFTPSKLWCSEKAFHLIISSRLSSIWRLPTIP